VRAVCSGRSIVGERQWQWQCKLGAELHHGGPRAQVLAAALLRQPAGDPESLDDARDTST